MPVTAYGSLCRLRHPNVPVIFERRLTAPYAVFDIQMTTLFFLQRLKLYYVAFLFRFAAGTDLQSLATTIYPLSTAFRADFKDASDMMKAARKDIAFGAPYRRLPSCKDRLVFFLKRQGSVIHTVYPDTAFGAGRSPFHLFTAKSANCQFFLPISAL